MEVLKFRLDDWRTNASIIGLMNILDNDGENQYEVVKDGYDEYLQVPFESLENFEEKYFKFFIDKYEKSLPWYKIVSYKEEVEKFIKNDLKDFNEESLKKLNKQIELVKDYLKRKNYTKVFDYIESDIDINTILSKKIKKINGEKNKDIQDKKEEIKESLELMLQVINYCNTETGRKYLGAKGVIYTYINRAIDGISFLNRQTKENDVYKDYKEYFLDTMYKYLKEDKKKYKYNCFNCDGKIKNLDTGLSMMNFTGFDVSRKPTHVWFEQNDVAICDKCVFLYSCLPAGFSYSDFEGIFVNANSSINELKNVNYKIEYGLNNEIKNTEKITYMALVNTIANKNVENLKYELADVQVIKYKNEKYRFNVMSKYFLDIIKSSNEDLEKLVKAGYKIGKEYVNIYDEVVDSIFNNRNLYLLIHKLFSYNLGKTGIVKTYYNYSHIYFIIRINGRLMKEEMTLEGKSVEKFVKDFSLYGFVLMKKYKEKDPINYENRIRGISYRILNALKTKNEESFMDNIINSYMYVGSSIPKDFVKVLNGEDNLGTIGYAFVSGLNGYDNEDKNNEQNKEDNK